jgi:hypothetical protein
MIETPDSTFCLPMTNNAWNQSPKWTSPPCNPATRNPADGVLKTPFKL